MNTIFDLIIYFTAFITLWYGSGLIIRSISFFSDNLKISSFASSFFILGMLTSIPEFAVGISSLSAYRPEIFVGNLIGGIPVIFLFVIPFLAVIGGGVSFRQTVNKNILIFAFVVIITPTLLATNNNITIIEYLIMLVMYAALFLAVGREKGLLDARNNNLFNIKKYSIKDILLILVGVGIVFISSQIIVKESIALALSLQISTYYSSLIILSLGTNLPELSIAIRSVLFKTKEIALGDYLGSAAANTFLFGFFGLMHGKSIYITDRFYGIFAFLLIGFLVLYFGFIKYKKLTRLSGLILLVFFALYILTETFIF